MRIKYKLLFIIPMIMIGCAKEHHVVVQKISGNTISGKDIESDTGKTFIMNNRNCEHLAYIRPGDTLLYFDDGHIGYRYKDTLNIPQYGHLYFNSDSLYVRQNRKLCANIKKRNR